jgi:hypothetical protein
MPGGQIYPRRTNLSHKLRKRKEPPDLIRDVNASSTPTYIFCGSPYNLRLSREKLIAVDFDGTIAQSMRPYDPRRAGPPLNPDDPNSMFNKVKKLVRNNKVIILTARMNTTEHTPEQIKYTRRLISGWTKKYFGVSLPCTAEKHHLMEVIYDDRAVGVNPKTGRVR